MFYTNKELEIVKNEKGEKELELCPMYGLADNIIVDGKITEYVKKVDDKFHKYLTFIKTKKDLLILTNKKDDSLYLALDTLDYKYFDKNGEIFCSEEDDVEEIIKHQIISNRSKTCSWDNMIFKVNNKKDFIIFKLQLTSGLVKYLTIYNKIIKIHNNLSLAKYLESIEKTLDVEEMDWFKVEK